jgi:hypothetical protein
MALYLLGMASTSCSTSDWDRNRGGLSGSEGNGTLIAGLIASRLSATAASRHWRSAKTALRMVEGERLATQLHTAALVILTSGVVLCAGRCRRQGRASVSRPSPDPDP